MSMFGLVFGSVVEMYVTRRYLQLGRSNHHVPPQLSKDKLELVDWPFCRIYLMNDSNYPAWIVMVPRKVCITLR